MGIEVVFLHPERLFLMGLTVPVLWLIFLWKEWEGKLKLQFILNGLICLLAILSISFLILEPAVPQKANQGEGVVLTSGYSEARLDSLLRARGNMKVIPYEAGQHLGNALDSVGMTYILGYGIPYYDLWQFENGSALYLGNPEPKGFWELSSPEKLVLGTPLHLNGRYSGPDSTRIFLKGPGGKALDSILLPPNTPDQFSLDALPKVVGNFVYTLEATNTEGVILETNPLPLRIEKLPALEILILNTFPTFETKYLKNYLAELGHRVLVRSQITRNRFTFEYLNREQKPINRLDVETLKDVDLLIMDGETWNGLGNRNRTEIFEAVNDGLGIYIQPEESIFRNGLPGGLSFMQDRSGVGNLDRNSGSDLKRFPYKFASDLDLISVLSQDAQILSAYKRQGRGRIGTALFKDSWELLLKGEPESYSEVWAAIISDLSRRTQPIAEWRTEPEWNFIHQPFEISINTDLDNPKLLDANNNPVGLLQDVRLPYQWRGTYIPQKTGWHRFSLNKDSVSDAYFFVFEEHHWSSVSNEQTRLLNQRWFTNKKESVPIKELQAIHPAFFYLLFLLSMGWLWLYPKFR